MILGFVSISLLLLHLNLSLYIVILFFTQILHPAIACQFVVWSMNIFDAGWSVPQQ